MLDELRRQHLLTNKVVRDRAEDQRRHAEILERLEQQQAMQQPRFASEADLFEHQSQQRIDNARGLLGQNRAMLEGIIPRSREPNINRYRGDQTPMTSHQRRLLAAAARDRLAGGAAATPEADGLAASKARYDALGLQPGDRFGDARVMQGQTAPLALHGGGDGRSREQILQDRALRRRTMRNRMLAKRVGGVPLAGDLPVDAPVPNQNFEQRMGNLHAQRAALQARGREQTLARADARRAQADQQRQMLQMNAMLGSLPPQERGRVLSQMMAQQGAMQLQERDLSAKAEMAKAELSEKKAARLDNLDIQERRLRLEGKTLKKSDRREKRRLEHEAEENRKDREARAEEGKAERGIAEKGLDIKTQEAENALTGDMLGSDDPNVQAMGMKRLEQRLSGQGGAEGFADELQQSAVFRKNFPAGQKMKGTQVATRIRELIQAGDMTEEDIPQLMSHLLREGVASKGELAKASVGAARGRLGGIGDLLGGGLGNRGLFETAGDYNKRMAQSDVLQRLIGEDPYERNEDLPGRLYRSAAGMNPFLAGPEFLRQRLPDIF